MAARTGTEYIKGLQAQECEVWLRGERVKDVTTHPGLANGVRAIASLYDLQHDPKLRDEMTFVSPTSGERLGLSFIIPRTREELARRGVMMLRWARTTCGMMGRSPDFMNVTFAAWAASARYFARGRPEFGENIRRYYEYISERDLTLTHSLINLQRSRTASGVFNLEEGTALQVIRETDAGIVVRGARILATLGPLSDEIAVYSPRVARHTETHSPFALNFAIPCATPGLKFLCRESFDLGRSHFEHPLGSRFEEMDCVVFFNDVLVPWERVFLLGDVDLLNATATSTHSMTHTAHQGAAKNIAKCEFVLGLALMMTRTIGNAHLPHSEERLAELMLYTELMKACMRACEADAELGREHPQSLHDRVPAHGGDPAAPRVQQLHDHADRGGLPRAAGARDRAVPRDRYGHGARSREALPPGVGRRRERLRQPAGALRALLRQRSPDPRAGARRDLSQGRGDGPRPEVARRRVERVGHDYTACP